MRGFYPILCSSVLAVWLLCGAVDSFASTDRKKLASIKHLEDLSEQVMALENSLIDSLRANSQAKANLKKLHTLIALQQQERELGHKRMDELEETVHELELRRETLNEKIKLHQSSVRRFLMAIETSVRAPVDMDVFSAAGFSGPLRSSGIGDEIEQPRRKLLANMSSRGLKAIEELKADLFDADQLGGRIQEERQQLSNLFQDLNERDSVLELNRQLQVDILQKSHQERLSQLENYHKLKTSQAQVEQMLGDFNARRELERAAETDRVTYTELSKSEFGKLKGRLAMPVAGGKVLTAFGRAFDPKSQLFIFKKGVDIQSAKTQPVKAVFSGKVAFSGELPEYGRVTIIDHGDHFYTLCAHLGQLNKKPGDVVAAGEAIGLTDDTGVVYFEIRSKNVALNPLQWISGSFSLN